WSTSAVMHTTPAVAGIRPLGRSLRLSSRPFGWPTSPHPKASTPVRQPGCPIGGISVITTASMPPVRMGLGDPQDSSRGDSTRTNADSANLRGSDLRKSAESAQSAWNSLESVPSNTHPIPCWPHQNLLERTIAIRLEDDLMN